MGADIYLQSLYKEFEDKGSSIAPFDESTETAEDFRNRFFDAARASGGYFRNGYNAGDVMWAMGLTWHGAVSPMLDYEGYEGLGIGYLPIAKARELVEMIEARPLTRERVAAHIFENMTSGKNEHPLSGPVLRMMEKAMAEEAGEDNEPPPPLEHPDLDGLFGHLNERRDQLLTILRKSIELDEPLCCDL
jgi:hypothetical protein